MNRSGGGDPRRQRDLPAKTIVHDVSLPPVAQAANIALLILASAKRNNWEELAADASAYAHIVISDRQQELLDEHRAVLGYLTRAPARTVYACPICNRWAVIETKAAPPAMCNLTLGCEGRAVKASTIAPRFVKKAKPVPAL